MGGEVLRRGRVRAMGVGSSGCAGSGQSQRQMEEAAAGERGVSPMVNERIL